MENRPRKCEDSAVFDSEDRTVVRRALDLINAMFVMLVYMLRILYHALIRPSSSRVPPWSVLTAHPTLLVFLSGLGGPPFVWQPVVHDLRAWYPRLRDRCAIRIAGNVRALYRPVQHDRSHHTLPAIEAHCRRWGSRARLVLVGHSLGAVDAIWLGNAIRERFHGRVPTLTVALCGAFGTNTAPLLATLGVHPSLQQAVHCREGSFLQDLLHRARTLPHHPRSEQLFVMSRDDRTIVPPTNSLLFGLPGRANRHLSIDGAGHMGAVAAASPCFAHTIAAFVAQPYP